MKRFATTVGLAFGAAALLVPHVYAQSHETETKTKTKTEHASVVTYTGCIATEGQSRSYILANVVPTEKTTTQSVDGSRTTTTTYALVPDATVQLDPQIGHRVEVQGVLIEPGHGDAKVTTKTEVNGKEERSKTEIERGPYQQLRVMSVKPLGASCAVN
ncbi:MAG TPA: hypothetical protein VLV86_05080 [Vicinamibacterales bacterium]|nr:hypothetical protein [Vicinamibacterales bacterium]